MYAGFMSQFSYRSVLTLVVQRGVFQSSFTNLGRSCIGLFFRLSVWHFGIDRAGSCSEGYMSGMVVSVQETMC